MIHWLCDRCEPRLQKAVVRQDPYKTNQYLPRPAIFCDMLAYLESAAEDQREMIQQMLEDIADPSSDEDAPALNNGGHRHGINSVRSSGVATAFVHGVAPTQLCGCDSDGPKGNGGEGVSFTTMVLTLWTLALGAHTWFWLRKPVSVVALSSSTA